LPRHGGRIADGRGISKGQMALRGGSARGISFLRFWGLVLRHNSGIILPV
jgi:hypothetical protein